MSPDTPDQPAPTTVTTEVERVATLVGARIRDRRRQLGWSIGDVAERARVATTTVQKIEMGARGSLEMYVRLAEAVDMVLGIDLAHPQPEGSQVVGMDSVTPNAIVSTGPSSLAGSDLVHAAMGEQIVAMLSPHGIRCGVDEPWQHYRYSGRADILAWHLPHRAMLHVENRTRFPDVQDAIGRFNGKRAYLAGSSWERLGMDGPPRAETHVMLALWSLEVLDVLRAFPGTFGAVCPDPPDAFLAWLAGKPPTTGVTSSLVLFDPFATGSQARFVSLREALGGAKPRVAGYAAAAELLRARPVASIRTPRDRRIG